MKLQAIVSDARPLARLLECARASAVMLANGAAVALVCGLSLAAPAQAVPLAYDGFDYAVGPLAGADGGFGWAQPWGQQAGAVADGSLTPPAGTESFYPPPTGNHAVISDVAFNLRPTTTVAGGIGTLYGSFLVNPDVFFVGSIANVKFGFGPFTGLNFRAQYGDSHWVISNGFSGTHVSETHTDAVDLIVFSLAFDVDELGTDLLSVWFNADPAGSPTFSTDALLFGSVPNRVTLTLSTSGLAELAFDEIRLGTSLADVLPNDVSPVPLPAALPLFSSGLVGLGLLGWRRARRKSGPAAV